MFHNFETYDHLSEQQASRFLTQVTEDQLMFAVLGLTGEAGEVANKIKKSMRGDKELDKEAIALELGDVLWYLAAVARNIGWTLEGVANFNYKKLNDREQRGTIQGNGDDR